MTKTITALALALAGDVCKSRAEPSLSIKGQTFFVKVTLQKAVSKTAPASPDSLPAPVRIGPRAGRVVSRRGSVPPMSPQLVLSTTVKVSQPLVRRTTSTTTTGL